MTQKKERVQKFKEIKGLETVPFQLKKYWENISFAKRIPLALFSRDCYPYRNDFSEKKHSVSLLMCQMTDLQRTGEDYGRNKF